MQLNRTEILEKLREILREASGDEKADAGFSEASCLMTDMGLSSVDILYLVIASEESFGIRFENVSIRDFETVGSVVDYIQEKLK